VSKWELDTPALCAAERAETATQRPRQRRHRVTRTNDITVEVNARPMWFTKNGVQVCDGTVSRSGGYRETVRSETVMPSFCDSPWIPGAPKRKFFRGHAPNEGPHV
jgi:hypothetical protein